MVSEIDLDAFAAAHAAGAVVIDVREPFEYVSGHVPGARLVPMGRVHGVAGDLPRGEPIYLICQSGNRSYTAAGWLRIWLNGHTWAQQQCQRAATSWV